MKVSLLSLLLMISFQAYSLDECPIKFGREDYLEKVADLAINADSCYAASQVVEACALGASGDVYTVGAAISRCQQDLPVLEEQDSKTYEYLKNKCDQKYENIQGTLYRSMHAFCHLSVVKLMLELTGPVE